MSTHSTQRTSKKTMVARLEMHTVEVQLYKVSDVMQVLSMSRTVVFELLRSGRLRPVKQGRIRLIPTSAIRDYITLLEKEAEAA